MVNVISNQLTTLTASPAPEKPKPPVKVDPPVVPDVRPDVVVHKPVVAVAEKESPDSARAETPEQESVSAEELAQAVEEINLHFQNLERDLKFSIDKVSGRQVITVLDSKTKEVIREIPSAEVRALAQMLKNGMGGLIETEA